jgi:hypothetical protein
MIVQTHVLPFAIELGIGTDQIQFEFASDLSGFRQLGGIPPQPTL